jgi:hypothetical protein
MILQTLETLGPLHGYAISARSEEVSRGALQVNMGTLYPGLNDGRVFGSGCPKVCRYISDNHDRVWTAASQQHRR